MYELAMFPLEHTVLPGAVVPLHIFEPRYRALATDVTLLDEPEFGIAMIERGREVGGDDERAAVGVVARVLEAEEFPDGRWGIVVAGTRRITVDAWLPDDPYPRAQVRDWPDTDVDVDPEDLDALIGELDRVVAAARRLAPEHHFADPEIGRDDPGQAIWHAVLSAGLGPLDNQALLQEPGCRTRLEAARRLIGERADVLDALADQGG